MTWITPGTLRQHSRHSRLSCGKEKFPRRTTVPPNTVTRMPCELGRWSFKRLMIFDLSSFASDVLPAANCVGPGLESSISISFGHKKCPSLREICTSRSQHDPVMTDHREQRVRDLLSGSGTVVSNKILPLLHTLKGPTSFSGDHWNTTKKMIPTDGLALPLMKDWIVV